MNTQPQLQLRDIHLPEAVSWWPPAPGYWLVLGIIASLLILGWLLIRRYRRAAVRRAALAQLNAFRQEFRQHNDAQQLISQLSALLRRAAISSYPRSDCAALTGEQWLRWLDQGLKAKSEKFSGPAGQLLLTAPYQKTVSAEQTDALLALCREWLSALPAHSVTRGASQ